MHVLMCSIVIGSMTGAGMSFKIDPRIPFYNGTITYKDPSESHSRHRCGMCPTYFSKICAFDASSNSTYIFDNYCIMEMYNCVYGTVFQTLNYDHCLFFGNFAYVHGFKKADEDYDDTRFIMQNSKKNPDFV